MQKHSIETIKKAKRAEPGTGPKKPADVKQEERFIEFPAVLTRRFAPGSDGLRQLGGCRPAG